MNVLISKLFDIPYAQKEVKILILGLDNAGKTTILYKLKIDEAINSTPTIGFNVETINYKGAKFIMWDLGGQDKIRSLWKHYFTKTDALIFVVDSNDQKRLDIAKKELYFVMENEDMKNAKLLILCNKQDLPNACTPNYLAKYFEIEKLKTEVFIQKCVAIKGIGLYEGLDWITGKM